MAKATVMVVAMDGLKAVPFNPFSSAWVGREAHDSSVEKHFRGPFLEMFFDGAKAIGYSSGLELDELRNKVTSQNFIAVEQL